MADYINPNVSDLHHVPVHSGDPSMGLFNNSMHELLISPSSDIGASSSDTGINIGQDQGQVDSIDTDFFIEIEDDFSVDWDRIDMEEKRREEKRARKRIMDRRRQTRLSKGFAVLRSLLPRTGSSKVTYGY
jgi:Cu2+-containing amine oxidase